MKSVLPLFVFIDACGWEIIKDDPFVWDLAPNRKRLASVFGYSSACVPSILSGRWPAAHRNWCYFVYDPPNSPFGLLRPLRWLPRQITSRRSLRRRLSHFLRARLGLQGYFDLYNVPFEHIHLFDFTEKKNPLEPGGMNRGENIFDFLVDRRIPYHVSAPQQSEEANLAALLRDVESERIDFAFLYWPGLDGLLHCVGNDSLAIGPKLRQYEEWLRALYRTAQNHYDEIRLYVFSDHGMANCDVLLDLKRGMERLPVRMPRDYVAVYDSTMARFWFFNPQARQAIVEFLEGIPQGRILEDAELRELGTFFEDRYFGEVIFLVKEGVLIVPSHMGERPIRAMHGYHPSEQHSFAVLCSNQPELPQDLAAIPDIFRLMTRDAEQANSQNRSARVSVPVCS